VLYSKDTSYDNNKDNCWRLQQAYSSQMNQNVTWAKGPSNLTFVACSGAHYSDIAADPRSSQLSKAGHPSFITLTVGGNNIGFYNIVVNCLYQPERYGDYGNPYDNDPDQSGNCIVAMQAAMSQYDNWETWMRGTMQDVMLKNPPNPTFDLFLTGYVHFFNTNENAQCNSWSFGVWLPGIPGNRRPLLSYPLRRDLNDLVQKVNEQYSAAVDNLNKAAILKGSRAHFVDISPAFDTHRFCEDGYSYRDQYYNGDMWIWNLSPNIPTGQVADYPTVESVFSTGFVDTIMASGIFNDTIGGVGMRPFHPKTVGHQAIQNEILAVMKAVKLAGTIWE